MASLAFLLLLQAWLSPMALAAASLNASFCSSSNTLDCSGLRQGNCTPPMLMMMKAGGGKARQIQGHSAGSTAGEWTGGGARNSDASGSRQQAVPRSAAGRSASETSDQTRSRNFSCKVGNKHVDWFIAIKKPGSHEYAYLSSEDETALWKYARDITASGPVFNTLRQAVVNQGYVSAYSDKPPGKDPSGSYGHLKGLLMTGHEQDAHGFWMMYSARNFPSFGTTSPLNQNKAHAQSFICITAAKTQLDNLASQLDKSKPRYYDLPRDISLSLSLDTTSRNRGQGQDGDPNGNILVHQLQSSGGKAFNVFIKGKNSNIECIFQKIRATYPDSYGFRVQSWLRFIPDERLADVNEVTNVQRVTMTPVVDPTNRRGWPTWNWTATSDHSKWCVSNKLNIVCLSDLNRMTDQLTQGGAAVCFKDDDVWRAFNALVN